MSKPNYTKEQTLAITQTGANILVAASAGSGKTMVLTERIVRKIKQGTSIDELMVATFTEKAAAEMKERIEKLLHQAVENTTDDALRQHLQTQITLLPQAHISTLHAFCLRVIRQFFYLIDMDPIFRLMSDDIETQLLKESVWEKVQEDLFAEEDIRLGDMTFKELAAHFFKPTANNLMDLVLQLYDFSRSHANPNQWLDEIVADYAVDSIDDLKVYQAVVKPYVISVLEQCLSDLQSAVKLLETIDRSDLSGKKDTVAQNIQSIQQSKESIETVIFSINSQKDYETIANLLHHMQWEKWTSVKTDDSSIKKYVDDAKRLKDDVKKQVTYLAHTFFLYRASTQLEMFAEIKKIIQALVLVVKRFTKAYEVTKKDMNVLEFNDLEHLALQILAPMRDGVRSESVASAYYRHQFKEVLIDEYQDVNRLQEEILTWLTRGDNLFMVGDMKQSIYAFRLADPSLFLEKYERFAGGKGGQRIILAENFRSRAEVLHNTNFIFKQIMDKDLGEMAYDEQAHLKVGNTGYEKDDNMQMEVLLFEKKTNLANETTAELKALDTAVVFDKKEGAIHLMAQKIAQLKEEGFLVTQKDGTRQPVTYKDIAILVPTRSNNTVIQSIFESYKIPVNVKESQEYFQRTEVMMMLSLLKLIDNPMQDIPLAAVLRSPIVSLNDNELAFLRIHLGDSQPFYNSVDYFISTYDKLSETIEKEYPHLYDKLSKFAKQLNDWRNIAKKESLATLIWAIYNETQLLDYVLGLPSGKQRQANLHALYELARDYEVNRFKGLFQFIEYIERLQSRDRDLTQAPSESDNTDQVQLMTIHASKGLEFPIVFLFDIDKAFNTSDTSGMILSDVYGVAQKYENGAVKAKATHVLYEGIKLTKRNKLLSEEMRKLYVALTRAKEKLILVGEVDNAATYYKKIESVLNYKETVLPFSRRENGATFLSWIGMSLLRHPNSKNDYLEMPHDIPVALSQTPATFTIQFFNADHLKEGLGASLERETIGQWIHKMMVEASEEKDNASLKTLDYAYYEASMTTAYQSVSELKRLSEDPDISQMDNALEKLNVVNEDKHTIDKEQPVNASNMQKDIDILERRTHRYMSMTLPHPKFYEAQKVTATVLGTSIHLFLQTLPLHENMTRQELYRHLDTLVAKGLIETSVAAEIDLTKIERLLDTSFGKWLVRANNVQREVPFSLVIPADKLFNYKKEMSDSVLIHGIVDGYVEEDDGIVLFDYKSDRIGGKVTIETLKDRYKRQLESYEIALRHILNKPVKHIYLCAIDSGEVIDLKQEKG